MSGYHMAVVAGVVFFVIRALLALIPGLASRHPIKKWAALFALAAATFYLLLSGAEVATQRSYYMIGIVLVAVLVDRTAVTFRTLAIAALAVLLLAPEAVVHPSFQMSFAATLALVAGYRHGLPFARPNADTSFGARIALWGVREIAGLIFASLLAGLATTPYAAFHFHRQRRRTEPWEAAEGCIVPGNSALCADCASAWGRCGKQWEAAERFP